MKFRPGARLDPGQVQDRRGARGLAVGGGAGTLLVVLVLAVLNDVPPHCAFCNSSCTCSYLSVKQMAMKIE